MQICSCCGKPKKPDFSGHRYGGQSLKPSVEPVVLFQKPYSGRPIENIVETGAGALWIDGGRIPINNDEDLSRQNGGTEVLSWGGTYGSGNNEAARRKVEGLPTQGRWPSNLILHCSCSPTRPDKSIHDESCAVAVLDGQSGELGNNFRQNPANKTAPKFGKGIYQDYWGEDTIPGERNFNDSGPASRMFYQSDWVYEVTEQLAAADSIRYEPKASSNEREIGLDNLETQTRHRVNAGGLENEPRFAPTQVKNDHPCQKPLALTRYLATLLSPPKEYTPRRLLIPFSGAGSEICGAILSGGFEEIVAIEMNQHYCEIAEARVKYWTSVKDKVQTFGLDYILQNSGKGRTEEKDGQLKLFEV